MTGEPWSEHHRAVISRDPISGLTRLEEQGLEGWWRNAWVKMRVNRAQEFVIGGYTLGGGHFDALIFGYWEGDRLMYAARTRSGFTPALREQLHQRFRGLETQERPFANLPEGRAGRNVRDPLPKAWPPTRHPGSTSPLQAGDNRAAVESMDRELCHGAVPEGTLQ